MKVRNIGKRSIIIDGNPLSVGESTIVSDKTDVSRFLSRGQISVEGAKIYERSDLESKKMNELRKIGKPLGAKDTSKSELIEEIIEKQGE